MNKLSTKVLIIFSAAIIAVSFASCSLPEEKEDLSTDTWSSEFTDKQEKIEFFEKYVVCPSAVLDTEFHIVYNDNSTGLVPGPSDWSISAAVKIDPAESSKWTENMDLINEDQIDMFWWVDLPLEDWDLSGDPVYYKRPEAWSYIILYEEQGIVIKYFFTT